MQAVSSPTKEEMKATPSRDGELRFTVKITARVGRSDLIDAIALHADMDQEFPKTRREALKTAVWAISRDGDNMWARAEDIEESVRKRAQEVVDRLFPELITKPTPSTETGS